MEDFEIDFLNAQETRKISSYRSHTINLSKFSKMFIFIRFFDEIASLIYYEYFCGLENCFFLVLLRFQSIEEVKGNQIESQI